MMKGSLKKIILIGPAYPYRGGISHYVGLMYRALSKSYDVSVVSYKFQYPRLLYKKEQRDYENDSLKIEDTKYWLHTVNPLNWLNTAKKIRKEVPDMVIIQWWHPYFAPCYWLLAKLLKKTNILFVCHNVFPHERFFMDRLLTKAVLRQGDRFIVHSAKDAADLEKIVPDALYEQTVIPTYNMFKIENMTKEKARELLDISSETKLILFFGFVREYKGLKYLLEALPSVVRKNPEAKLMVVGDFGGIDNKRIYIQLVKDKNMKEYVDIFDGYIPDKEIEKFFAACDLVVLPYESATQSGIVPIAYSFEKPVVVTNVGGLPDVVSDGKTGFVVEAKQPEKLAEAINRFFLESRENEFEENVRKEAYRFSWDKMVESVKRLYDIGTDK